MITLLLSDPTPHQQLVLLVGCGLILSLALWLSITDLVCHLRSGVACFRRRRGLKLVVGGSAVLALLALMGDALFIMALTMHGPEPTLVDLLLVLAGGFIPLILLIAWMAGSRIASGILALGLAGVLLYLTLLKPDFVVRVFAENDFVWAQKWMAQEEPRQGWYQRAAQSGDPEAQYLAGLERVRKRNWSSGNRLFRKAAEQGHPEAMIELARHGDTLEERKHWLETAFRHRHPDALYLKAEQLLDSDLPEVRRLLLEAAEGGSTDAMFRLIAAYTAGGILFDQDTVAAERWSGRLREAARGTEKVAEYEIRQMDVDLPRLQQLGRQIASGDPDSLFSNADDILKSHRADDVAKQRAFRYLERAASKGHDEAAYRLGRHYGLKNPDPVAAKTALEWFRRGADADNVNAMGELVRYYRGDDPDYPRDLQQAKRLTLRILNILGQRPKMSAALRKWQYAYSEIESQLEKHRRQGGSLQQLEAAAKQNSHQKFLYGKALLSKDFGRGHSLIRESAEAGDQDARFHLAQTTLRQPRTTRQEIDAITSLQQLVEEGYSPAYKTLAGEFQRNAGRLPLNDYLAYRSLKMAGKYPALTQQVDTLIKAVPTYVTELDLQTTDDTLTAIRDWYEKNLTTAADPERLATNYRNLVIHFQAAEPLRTHAEQGDAESQYRYGHYLLTRDFKLAFAWMEKAAEQGLADAQYEVAYRLLLNNRNPPELYAQAIRHLEAAAGQQHIAAKGLLAFYYSGRYKHLSDKVRHDNNRAKRLYREVLSSNDSDIVYTSEINGKISRYRRDKLEERLAELR